LSLRDGCVLLHHTRHFVPGYFHSVPPGQKPFNPSTINHLLAVPTSFGALHLPDNPG
jgi:hypothetical protein